MRKIVYFTALPLLLFAETLEEIDSPLTPIASEEDSHKPLSLSIVQGDGSLITLSDGTLYQIDPKHWDVSSGWIANPAEVKIENTEDGSEYPLIITNKATGNFVRAALVQKQEESAE